LLHQFSAYGIIVVFVKSLGLVLGLKPKPNAKPGFVAGLGASAGC